MACPICQMPSAFNAREGDQRCGPCHNFRVERLEGYAVILRLDFQKWLSDTAEDIRRANNQATYLEWLAALNRAHRQAAQDGSSS